MRTKFTKAITAAFLFVAFVSTFVSGVKAQTTTFAQFLQIPAQ